MTTQNRVLIKDIVEARSNSQNGASEIDLAGADGKVITLQMDAETMLNLLNVVIRLQRVRAPTSGETLELRAFPIAWWTLGLTPDNAEVVETFELKDGGHIGFRMPIDMAGRLSESLRVTLNNAANAARPGKGPAN
jgi:hypothetical protein